MIAAVSKVPLAVDMDRWKVLFVSAMARESATEKSLH